MRHMISVLHIQTTGGKSVSTFDIVVLTNRDDDAHSSIRKQVRFKLLTWRAMTKATWAKLPVLSF